MLLTGSGGYLYSLNLLNRGTVLWNSGGFGCGSTPTTTITNIGLWQMTGDNAIYNGGGGVTPIFVNSGIVRKTAGTGTSQIGFFSNQPGGLVDSKSGAIQFYCGGTNSIVGSYTTTSPGIIKFDAGIWTDGGGVLSGTGTIQFDGTTLNLRTNIVAGLLLAAGDVYITGTNLFQQAGSITNLTLDGATLHGTNNVTGTLTMDSGSLLDRIIVQPSGQLIFATAGSKLLYTGTIINQGTVTVSNGLLNVGGTPPTVISNGGLWQITGDYNTSYGGG